MEKVTEKNDNELLWQLYADEIQELSEKRISTFSKKNLLRFVNFCKRSIQIFVITSEN